MEIRTVLYFVYACLAIQTASGIELCPVALAFCIVKLDNDVLRYSPQELGAYLMRNNEHSGNSFVYSELTLLQKFIFLLHYVPNGVAEDIIMRYNLPRKQCDNNLCASLLSFIQSGFDIKTVEYVNILYYDNSKKPYDFEGPAKNCFSNVDQIAVNFSVENTVFNTINRKYQELSGRKEIDALKDGLKKNTDFYMFQFSKLNSPFSNTQPVTSSEKFTDLDGAIQTVDWLEITGNIRPTVLPYDGFDLKTVQIGINNGLLQMVYIQPLFKKSDDLSEKSQKIQKVLSDLKTVVWLSTNRRFQSKTFTSILVPAIDMRTDLDLKPMLGEMYPALFQNGTLNNIYKDTNSTLYEFRTFEDFSNKGKNTQKVSAGKVDRILDTPFVFALVNGDTRAILKAGAFIRAN